MDDWELVQEDASTVTHKLRVAEGYLYKIQQVKSGVHVDRWERPMVVFVPSKKQHLLTKSVCQNFERIALEEAGNDKSLAEKYYSTMVKGIWFVEEKGMHDG